MISNWKRFVLFCLITITINSCSSIQRTIIPTTDVAESTTLPTETLRPTTLTTTVPSRVPLKPTLSTTEAEIKALELLSDDVNCRLPCFFGIVPGQTDEIQISSILHQFDAISPGTEIKFLRDELIVSLDIIYQTGYSDARPEIVKWLEAKMLVYREQETNIQMIYQNPYNKEYFKNYTLSYLLANYGPPDQAYVFLDTGIADMGLGIDLYLLHLDYSKYGWVAHFEMPLRDEGSTYLGCPSEAFTSLRLWSPDNPAKDYELDPKVLFTIQEATGLTLEEFFQIFKDPTITNCLETPADIHK